MNGDDEAYLKEGFDATELKVPQLRNLLVKHKVEFPSAAKKGELVNILKSQVLSRAAKLRKEAKKQRKAKADGRDIEVVQTESIAGAAQPEANAAKAERKKDKEKIREKDKEKIKARIKAKNKHKNKPAAAESTAGAKRKHSEEPEAEPKTNPERPQPKKDAGQEEERSTPVKAKRRVLQQQQQQRQQARSSSDHDSEGNDGSDAEYAAPNATPLRKPAPAVVLRTPARDSAGNFSDDNPFQSSSGKAMGSPESARKRRRKDSSSQAAVRSPSAATPLGALRKSQQSDVSLKVALPQPSASNAAADVVKPDAEAHECPPAAEARPPPAESMDVDDAEAEADADANSNVDANANAVKHPLLAHTEQETQPNQPHPDQSQILSASPAISEQTAPAITLDLTAAPSLDSFRTPPALRSPDRFTMTPDALRLMAADSRRRTQTSIAPSGRPPVSPAIPVLPPSVGSSVAAAPSGDIAEAEEIMRRRVATLRQHVESAGTSGARSHSRRSSIASIADSVGEARGVPSEPTMAAAAAGAGAAASSSSSSGLASVPGHSAGARAKRQTSFMRRLVLCALFGAAAFGVRTHTQFGLGFGSTRQDAAPLPLPASSALAPPPPLVDAENAPLADRLRYYARAALAAYIAPPPLECPAHATCLPFVPLDPARASQRVVTIDSPARDQWMAAAPDGSSNAAVPVVQCDAGFVLHFPPLSTRVLPLLPECVRDLSTEHRVRQLADAMIALCNRRRGQAQCAQSLYEQAREQLRWAQAADADADNDNGDDEGADEADEIERLGVSVPELSRAMAEMRSPRVSHEEFEALFRLAVEELSNKRQDAVASFVLEDAEEGAKPGAETAYFVSRRPTYPPLCHARRLALSLVLGNLRVLGGALGAVLTAFIVSRRLAAHRAEVRAADALVLSALARLRRQARRHYVDPALSPSPAIPSLQLRDLLLLSSGSPAVGATPMGTGGSATPGGVAGSEEAVASPLAYYDPRARASVWERVRQVVERSANVRCRTTAVRGEPMRVWEWIGPLDDDDEDELVPTAALSSPFSSPEPLARRQK
ncbi:hypothetical protein GGI07_005112 [Coemansia sp. Benny D115]|nr:hypothetical protein GGI07_005112 [Coemansia sp. Benny D115]